MYQMTKYWSYLTNKNNEILALETSDNIDKMKSDYVELIKSNFFDQFSGFTKIFISSKNPVNKPSEFIQFEIAFAQKAI
jgi:hypothetical protein